MTCPRCYRNIPEGSTISPCCGIWLYTNGPADPGHVFYDYKTVDFEVDEKLNHLREHANEIVGAAHAHLTGRIDGVLGAHNRNANWLAGHAKRVRNACIALAGTNVLTLVLLLLRVHA